MQDEEGAVKRLTKAALARVGYRLTKIEGGAEGMGAGLARMAVLVPVATVIDVGASDGRWSELAMRSFPNADYLLVEAQADPHEASLKAFSHARSRVKFVIAAAGDKEGTVHFDGSDPFGGVASHTSTGPGDKVVPMTTIDAEVARRGLQGPFLLKLDTHGFEVPIFEGASTMLANTDLIVVEAYNFDLMPGALRFPELCGFLEERGFRCADVVDCLRRPGDGVLWQFDLLFLRADRPEFASNLYIPS